MQARNWEAAIAACEREWKAGDPRAGAKLAKAYRAHRDYALAEKTARKLIGTVAEGDAQFVLGGLLMRDENFKLAEKAYRAAYDHHADLDDQVRDLHMRAGALFRLNLLEEASKVEAEAVTRVAQSNDVELQVYVYVGAAKLYRSVGKLEEARSSIQKAAEAAKRIDDANTIAWAEFELAMLDNAVNRFALALSHLEAASQALARAKAPDEALPPSIALNRAFALIHLGRSREALPFLDEAVRLKADQMHVLRLTGIALETVAPLEARRAFEAANAMSRSGDFTWDVPWRLGVVCARLGAETAAKTYLAQSMDEVRKIRSSSGEFESSVLANHRQPYLSLLGVLLRREQWDEALAVLAELDAAAMLPSTAEPMPLVIGSTTASTSAKHLEQKTATPAAIRAAWAERRLVVLFSDGLSLWRLQLEGGQVRASRRGDAEAIEKLVTGPRTGERAEALGRALFADLAPGELDVLLIGRVGKTLIPSLTLDGKPLLETLQVARVLGVSPRPAAVATRLGAPLVLGDPLDNLPAARAEAEHVATALGVTALLGTAATVASVRAMQRPSVFHFAGHAEAALGSVMHLADGSLTAKQLASLKAPPSMVVLSSCASGAVADTDEWASLAAAFVSAGTDTVVATRQSVPDSEAAALMQAFFAADGATTPVRALATAQLAQRGAGKAWQQFVVFRATPRAKGPALINGTMP